MPCGVQPRKYHTHEHIHNTLLLAYSKSLDASIHPCEDEDRGSYDLHNGTEQQDAARELALQSMECAASAPSILDARNRSTYAYSLRLKFEGTVGLETHFESSLPRNNNTSVFQNATEFSS